MPDAHQGYGFPIGGVAAFDPDEGIISPGGVGYDINCGVRLLRTEFTDAEISPRRKELLAEIFKEVPAGVGRGGVTRLSRNVLKEILVKGAEWAVENGYGTPGDLERTEERGRMIDADPESLSDRALERGIPQLGTLGAGNHFLEFQKVVEIFDKDVARTFGIHSAGQVTIMIHCGSRGLGHQVASDYIELMENKFGIAGLPDRELVNAPFRSDLGQRYYRSMCAAVNYAFANRQMIAHWVRDVFARVLGSAKGMDQVYDVCHNVAKLERHTVGGVEKRALRPSQRRDPELRPGPPGDPGRVPGRRPTRYHPREHGHGVLHPGRDRGGRGKELQLNGPRRGPGHEPPRGPQALSGRADPRRPGPAGDRAQVHELEGRRRGSRRRL